MNINWFPGHMKKTRTLIADHLKQVDAVIELRDARIPNSSKNPEIESLLGDKNKIIAMTKSDLASPILNEKWGDYFKARGEKYIFMDARDNHALRKLYALLDETLREKAEKMKHKGIQSFRRRIMILGIPNVGKSTLINSMAKRKGAEVGNRPGVTKAKKWIKLSHEMELLDTPGILWPKFEDEEVALNLAFTGAIKDEIMDLETLAYELITRLLKQGLQEQIAERYQIQTSDHPLETLQAIGQKRGFLLRGGEIDYERLSRAVLDDFRSGKMGRITLESPEI